MSAKPLDTPPSSDIEVSTARFPPSPPLSPKKRASISAVDRLVGTLRLLKAGRLLCQEDWKVFKLSPAEYAEVDRNLRKEEALWAWYDDKLRSDWEAREGRCILRMPTALHEGFIAHVEDAIAVRIADLADTLEKDGKDKEGMVAKELRKIYKGRSTTLELCVPPLENSSQESTKSKEERTVKRSPDATFYHPAQPDFPCLVVEVSYSQQHRDLPRLAESYIVDSSHAIRCAIGLDVSYENRSKTRGGAKNAQKDKKARVSIWRPDMVEDEAGEEIGVCMTDVGGMLFRSEDGEACDGTLEIRLQDLLPPSLLEEMPALDTLPPLPIPFADLTSFLAAAEDQTSESSVPAASTTRPTKFRKRKRTPSEELSDGREAEYVRLEEHERVKERKTDQEWRARSSRSGGDGGEASIEVVERRRSLRRWTSGRAAGDGS